MTAMPIDLVVSVFGGGGMKGEQGLKATFGGSPYHRDDATGAAYLAIWGSRNASRFRRKPRESGAALDVLREPPPGRLIWFNSGEKGRRLPVR